MSFIFKNLFTGLKISCLLLTLSLSNGLQDGDLCKWMNGRKYYVDLGESGIITAENVTISSNSAELGGMLANPHQVPQRCSVELITCPACHLDITILHMNIPTCSDDESCRCDFLWIKDSTYSKTGKEYCGFKENSSLLGITFESKTKLVSLDFLYSSSYKEAFVLQFMAKRNLFIYRGGYDYYHASSVGIIESPNFPEGYPSDYSAEYIIQNVDLTGFVRLIFTDFQLSQWSFIEVFDSNGTRIDVYNGNTFRPPAIFSSGSSLTVKFQANDEYPSSGFRAEYTFGKFPEKFWINRPSTDCGGYVEDFGGAITMVNMVPSNSVRTFDCIWLIRPRNHNIPETKVAIRVAQFEEMGSKSELIIRQGQHSNAPLLESLTPAQHYKMPRGKEYVVPVTSGFYIRLIGYFSNKSHLAIIYTTYRYEECYATSDFICQNRRCIRRALQCDGFNHCGDGSDEATCYGINPGTPVPDDGNWWRTLTPNYYFPKQDVGSGPGTNTLILVTSLAGLGMFILTTVMILVKLHRQRQDDNISREILHTISADLERENYINSQGNSDLPTYDPPPSYEDVIKLYLPPPPPYSSINNGHSRLNHKRNNGSNNRPRRNNESVNVVQDHSRHSRTHQNLSHGMPQPLILKVQLPEEDMHNQIRNNITEIPILNEVNMTNQNSPTSTHEKSQKLSEILCVGNKDDDQNIPNSNYIMKMKSKTSPTKAALNLSKLKNNISIQCECQGACSCKLIKKIACEKKGKGNKIDHSSEFEKSVIKKHTSFKDMMHKGICRASSCAISKQISLSGVILPQSQKSKKLYKGDKCHSLSAGPSSPTSTSFPESENKSVEIGKKPLFLLGHRRSSSGPSDLNLFLVNIASLSQDSASALPLKATSDNQLSTDKLYINQINDMPSSSNNELQYSSLVQKDVPNHFIPKEDSISSSARWWPLSHKMNEIEEISIPKGEHSWNACDTIPLLENGLTQPAIIKNDEKHNTLTHGNKLQAENSSFSD